MPGIETKKLFYGVSAAIILAIILVLPATQIITFSNSVLRIPITYADIEIAYILFLVIICKIIFKIIDKVNKRGQIEKL